MGILVQSFQLSLPVSSSSLMHLQTTNQDEHNGQKTSSLKAMDISFTAHEKQRRDLKMQFDADHNTRTKKCNSGWAVKNEVYQKLPSAGVLRFVNIDSYEPDSSGEEEDLSLDQSCVLHKRVGLICQHGKEFDDLCGPDSYVLTEFSKLSNLLAQEMDTKTDQYDIQSLRTGKTNMKNDLLHSVRPDICIDTTCTGGPHIILKCTSIKEATQSEIVVRPKVRNQANESHFNKRKFSQAEETSWTPDLSFNFSSDECTSGIIEQAEQNNNVKVGDDFFEDLDFEEKCGSHEKDDESSEYSEGEWTASLTSDTGLKKKQHSSDESWEMLPCLDKLPSSSSSLENVPPLSLTQEEPIPLEEGKIPWLRCNEDSGSSSDDNTDSVSQFVHPGLFILNNSNNLEDDSSMSEDLDTEWRLLDDFDEGIGMAQATSYVDHPQLHTYVALEERLAQAMEAALAHLEFLAIDVEQVHPPASEQIIGCLPHIMVLDDHRGHEQCCPICCCEYVSEDIATQLPCHHMFHKLCITVWLRKSGTCPVCRYVLTSPTAFFPNCENPSSAHSTAGQTR